MDEPEAWYIWPDDIVAYSAPCDGYLWRELPDRPGIYVPVRQLVSGETQCLPGGRHAHPLTVTVPRPRGPENPDLNTRPTALYRLYDQADELIYVGVAVDPERRWKNHAVNSRWWPNVQRRSVEWHDDRPTALAAETRAIVAENPVYNVAGKPRD